MRKFLVALLILSVMGGAFAEEGTWGSVSGEATLNTNLNLLPLDGDKSGDQPFVGMFGGSGGELKMTWEKTGDTWALNVPFIINATRFGTQTGDDKPTATYENGPLTVKIPFEFRFNFANAVPITWETVAVNAEYAVEDSYKFKLDSDAYPTRAITAVGGWYKFENKSELNVSKGAYGTEWWRASGLVLNAGGIGAVADGWEDAKTGLAYRYFLMDDQLQVGISFAGQAGRTMFGNTGSGIYAAPTGGFGDHFAYKFLGQATFGGRYTVEDGIDISAMLGLRYQLSAEKMYIPVHVGFAYKLPEFAGSTLALNGDTSMLIGPDDPIINLGAQAVYGDLGAADGFWAGARVTAVDLTADALASGTGMIFGLSIKAGYNSKLGDGNFGNGFDGAKEDAFYALAVIGSSDLAVADPAVAVFSVQGRVGYNAYPIIENKLKGSVDAQLNLSTPTVKDGDMYFGFQLQPKLEWNPIDDKSTVTITYTLGGNNTQGDAGDEFGLTKHDITVGFKWKF